jgi:hypothetical protein
MKTTIAQCYFPELTNDQKPIGRPYLMPVGTTYRALNSRFGMNNAIEQLIQVHFSDRLGDVGFAWVDQTTLDPC